MELATKSKNIDILDFYSMMKRDFIYTISI